MKIAKPIIPPLLESATLKEMAVDGELDGAQLTDVDAINFNNPGLEISSTSVQRVLFTGAQLNRITVRDSQFSQVDFSAAHLANGTLVRAQFINCRMTGVDFSQASIHDVEFRGCKLDLVNFRQADFRRVCFTDCTINEGDFIGATLSSTEFKSSVLEEANFSQVRCKQVDLRSSRIGSISGWNSLKGVTIDTQQLISAAPYLAHELGVIIDD